MKDREHPEPSEMLWVGCEPPQPVLSSSLGFFLWLLLSGVSFSPTRWKERDALMRAIQICGEEGTASAVRPVAALQCVRTGEGSESRGFPEEMQEKGKYCPSDARPEFTPVSLTASSAFPISSMLSFH